MTSKEIKLGLEYFNLRTDGSVWAHMWQFTPPSDREKHNPETKAAFSTAVFLKACSVGCQ